MGRRIVVPFNLRVTLTHENVDNYTHLHLDSSRGWDKNETFIVSDRTSESATECETPDPEFAETSNINEDYTDSDHIVDFDATFCFEVNILPNPFINNEADGRGESSSDYEEEPAFKDARKTQQ